MKSIIGIVTIGVSPRKDIQDEETLIQMENDLRKIQNNI